LVEAVPDCRLRVINDGVLNRIFGTKTESNRRLEKLRHLYFSLVLYGKNQGELNGGACRKHVGHEEFINNFSQ
jgi:hypothetical protein